MEVLAHQHRYVDLAQDGSGDKATANTLRAMTPVTIDSAAALARNPGFEQRYQLNLPMREQGVCTISRDSMTIDFLLPIPLARFETSVLLSKAFTLPAV